MSSFYILTIHNVKQFLTSAQHFFAHCSIALNSTLISSTDIAT